MPPFSVRGLDHVVLRVANLDRSLAFYCDLLGCVVERQLEDLGLHQLRAGQQLIDLVVIGSKLGGLTPASLDARNLDHFCLNLNPVEASDITTYLNDAGIETSEVAERYGAEGMGLSLYVQDPDGNTVELKGIVPNST